VTASPTKVNGAARPAVPVLGPWEPFPIIKGAMQDEPASLEAAAIPVPTVDPRAEAEAEAIRARAEVETKAALLRAEAEAEALRIEGAAKADAERIKAEEEARRLKAANDRAEMKLERDRADQAAYLARKAAEEAASKAATEKAEKAAAEETQREADREAEQERSESLWKWGARGIYAVCLIIAAPVQFLDFWDRHRPFLVAAPAMLEGIALVLACGAAWAVAHRRDVMPYRIGIMLGAAIAASINMRGGFTNPAIGFNAGLVGAIASMVGPVILMAYEHGIAQKADGIASYRERRAADKVRAKDAADREKAKAEKKAAEDKAKAEKTAQQKLAEAEQARRDEDRQEHHLKVWEVAESLRSARGSATVTEPIWSEAWYRVTGSKLVGVTAEIEALSRDAQARMQAATEITPGDSSSQVGSQKAPRPKRDPDAPDGRRFNGGIPPLRTPGDTQPYSALAKKQAALEQTARTADATAN
jgi:chemotaxis protein histidine kinase CheA